MSVSKQKMFSDVHNLIIPHTVCCIIYIQSKEYKSPLTSLTCAHLPDNESFHVHSCSDFAVLGEFIHVLVGGKFKWQSGS